MIQLLRLFFDVCLLRRGPQDVPASQWLLRTTVACYLAVGVVLLTLGGDALWRSTVAAAIDFALLAGITWGALGWRHLQVRFPQTLTTLAGAGVVIYLVELPVVYWLHVSAGDGGRPDPLAALLWFVLLLWSLSVMGHVLRHALRGTFALGMLFSVGYFAIETVLFDLLFPRAG